MKGQDTLCTVSLNDIRVFNHAISDLEACNELADSLNSRKERYKEINNRQAFALVYADTLIAGYDRQVALLQTLEKSYKKEAKRNKNWLKVLKPTATILAIIAVGEGAWIWITTKLTQ